MGWWRSAGFGFVLSGGWVCLVLVLLVGWLYGEFCGDCLICGFVFWLGFDVGLLLYGWGVEVWFRFLALGGWFVGLWFDFSWFGFWVGLVIVWVCGCWAGLTTVAAGFGFLVVGV